MDQGQPAPEPSVEERLANYFSQEDAPQDPVEQPEEQQAEQQQEEVQEETKEPQEEESITIDPDVPLFEVTVKTEGGQNEVKKVSLKDLESGYMMQADYQRKTAELARAREQLQQEAVQIIEPERQQYIQNLNILQQAVMALGASDLQQVDWERLSVEDPAKFQGPKGTADPGDYRPATADGSAESVSRSCGYVASSPYRSHSRYSGLRSCLSEANQRDVKDVRVSTRRSGSSSRSPHDQGAG
jgi:hypothetical protein